MHRLHCAVALILALVIHGPARAAGATPDDEFVGPFESWANAKADYGATGDGVTDDTAALQQALNELGTSGHAPVLYLPAGTYRVSSTLALESRLYVSIIGANPATTSLKWTGPAGGVLARFAGIAYSRINRLTFDGSNRAAVLVDQAWNCGQNYFDTGNEYTDDVFTRAGIGLRGGNNGCGFAETTVKRNRFVGLTTAGIALKNFNALDLWVWYSRFENCAVGITNDPGAGNFHVYESLFLNSTVSDMYVKNTGGFSIRNNTSIGSKAFWTTANPYRYPATITLQGNAISTTSPSPIVVGNQGPVTLIDNDIISAKTAAPVIVGYDVPAPDGDALLVGNRFSSPVAPVVKGRVTSVDNRGNTKFQVTSPKLPPVAPRRGRTVIEVAPGATAAVIQAAIDSAWQADDGAVVHLPYGDYPLETTLTIPARADLQIIGDGERTSLVRQGAVGPLLRVLGPTRAILRDFALRGGGTGEVVVLDDVDQRGSRLHFEQANLLNNVNANLLIDGVDHLVTDLRDVNHTASVGGSITVVGGPLAATGRPRTAAVNVYSGASCCNAGSAYSLSNGASLLVRDIWYEYGSAAAPYLRATGGGRLTVAGSRVAQPTNVPALQFSDFSGVAALLSSGIDARIRIDGNGNGGQVYGDGLLVSAGLTDYLDDVASPASAVAFQRVREAIAGGSSVPIAGVAAANARAIKAAVAHVRETQAPVIDALGSRVTDIRFHRVAVTGGEVGVRVRP